MPHDASNGKGRPGQGAPSQNHHDTDEHSSDRTDSPGPLFAACAAPASLLERQAAADPRPRAPRRRESARTTARALKGQNAAILGHMQTGARINQPKAIDLFQCYRLGARIWDLKQAGHDIQCEVVGRLAEYFLVGAA